MEECKEQIWKGFHHYQCRRPAVAGGYCKTHDPIAREERYQKRRAAKDHALDLPLKRGMAEALNKKLGEDFIYVSPFDGAIYISRDGLSALARLLL
jgi:hypothetical protein